MIDCPHIYSLDFIGYDENKTKMTRYNKRGHEKCPVTLRCCVWSHKRALVEPKSRPVGKTLRWRWWWWQYLDSLEIVIKH